MGTRPKPTESLSTSEDESANSSQVAEFKQDVENPVESSSTPPTQPPPLSITTRYPTVLPNTPFYQCDPTHSYFTVPNDPPPEDIDVNIKQEVDALSTALLDNFPPEQYCVQNTLEHTDPQASTSSAQHYATPSSGPNESILKMILSDIPNFDDPVAQRYLPSNIFEDDDLPLMIDLDATVEDSKSDIKMLIEQYDMVPLESVDDDDKKDFHSFETGEEYLTQLETVRAQAPEAKSPIKSLGVATFSSLDENADTQLSNYATDHLLNAGRSTTTTDDKFSLSDDTLTLHTDFMHTPSVPSTSKKVPDEREKFSPKYPCDWCNKSFVFKAKYDQHMRTFHQTHNIEKSESQHVKSVTDDAQMTSGSMQFVCEHCTKVFNSRFKLIRHQLIHSDSRQFSCTVCERTFHRKDHLKNHIKVHNPSKNIYLCDRKHCAKEYTSILSYRKHLAVHAAEEGNLDCKICNKHFDEKNDLLLHLKIHSGSRVAKNPNEKKYRCDMCDRKFFTKKDVRRHSVVHTGRRDFLCQYCPQRFGRKDHLVRHIKKSHSGLDLKRHLKKSTASSTATTVTVSASEAFGSGLSYVHSGLIGSYSDTAKKISEQNVPEPSVTHTTTKSLDKIIVGTSHFHQPFGFEQQEPSSHQLNQEIFHDFGSEAYAQVPKLEAFDTTADDEFISVSFARELGELGLPDTSALLTSATTDLASTSHSTMDNTQALLAVHKFDDDTVANLIFPGGPAATDTTIETDDKPLPGFSQAFQHQQNPP